MPAGVTTRQLDDGHAGVEDIDLREPDAGPGS
jgi:hypothetical protein